MTTGLAVPRSSRATPSPRPGAGGVVVIKFGGTSVASPARIRLAARRVRTLRREGSRPLVVVSAPGHTTDHLLARLSTVARGGSAATAALGREADRALATGEELSAALVATALLALEIPALSLRAAEAGLLATGEHGAGTPVALRADRLLQLLGAGVVPVVAGFQGVRPDGETVTLGRGGSDVSAVFLAAELGATECQIVTDVDGVYTDDPRRHSDAERLPTLSHAELVAITGRGAVVVHPAAATRAARAGLSLRVFHFQAPLRAPGGTVVTAAGKGAS